MLSLFLLQNPNHNLDKRDTNCAQDADVVLYTIEGGGHTWPGGKDLPEWLVGPTTHEVNATRLMWEFYLQHSHGPK
jgi:polyhydroxybutyrate depolymerase